MYLWWNWSSIKPLSRYYPNYNTWLLAAEKNSLPICAPYFEPKNCQDRVRMCKENLAKFKSGTWRLCDVLTGDESWFYWRQIGRKQANRSWVAEGQSPRTIARLGRFEPKTMVCIFFRTSGVELITHMKRHKTIDHQSYIDYCLDLTFIKPS